MATASHQMPAPAATSTPAPSVAHRSAGGNTARSTATIPRIMPMASGNLGMAVARGPDMTVLSPVQTLSPSWFNRKHASSQALDNDPADRVITAPDGKTATDLSTLDVGPGGA